MYQIERMTVKEAAKRLRMTQQTLRHGIRQDKYKWGTAIKTSSRYVYVIDKRKFLEANNLT